MTKNSLAANQRPNIDRRAAIRERRIKRMFAAVDVLAEAKLPPVTMEEIQAEVEVERVRAEQRAAGHCWSPPRSGAARRASCWRRLPRARSLFTSAPLLAELARVLAYPKC